MNFIPQRYLADNEIIQELVDLKNTETKRGYPKGLDVMAAFGSASAENYSTPLYSTTGVDY